jgi:protein-L-isoaspartate(D-aspartate) O-methyltransferase
MTDYAVLRQRMVDNQLRPSEVTNHAVLRAFLNVPRELFVTPAEAPFAYADRELVMAEAAPQRRMMDPVRLARLVNALPLSADANVMVVGAGTGYSAAILSRLSGRVMAVEEDKALAALARERLPPLGAANVEVVEAKLSFGCPAKGPYDAILLAGAVETVPQALIDQLKPGGILATIERDERASRAVLYERIGTEATKWPRFDAWATLLPGFERPREFVF